MKGYYTASGYMGLVEGRYRGRIEFICRKRGQI